MTLSNRIITYILKRTGTTLDQLEGVVVSNRYTLDELYTALETVHRDKRIARRVFKGQIVYTKALEPKGPTDHLKWVRENYPPMDETNDGSGFDIDLSWMFLKTKEERDAYKAAASGKPLYMIKTHGSTRKKDSN